ncbi:MAG: hypothetical protein SchgKO_03300 [Schleiferiaceae bacterium]
MRRILYVLIAIFGWILPAEATHNRAGEITYRHIAGLTYEITITTYTNALPGAADRCDLTIQWGDNTTSVLVRNNGAPSTICSAPARAGEVISATVRKNIYTGTHTYQAPGFYTLALEDPNRNAGVSNIPVSVEVPFYINTTLVINDALGPNNSPELLNPPIDDGCINRTFIHNPSAFDIDGDSLAYELVDCRGAGGTPILATYDPSIVQDPLTIDSVTGDMLWDTPQAQGQFNFAILISEFRKGPNGQYQFMGSVTRDLQVDIESCSNQPPEISPLGPFCVEAGTTLSFNVGVSDPDFDPIRLTATGGPFELAPPPLFNQPVTGVGSITAPFSWATNCSHVRQQPYYINFKAEDTPANINDPSLVDIETVEIQIVGPSPKNPVASAQAGSIVLNWDQSVCSEVVSYDIYKREGSYGFSPAPCEVGVPAYTGYTYLASTTGLTATTYTDTEELTPGNQYCYMVVAIFPDGAESYASVEFCAELEKTIPILTNVSVLTTDIAVGEMDLRWVAPDSIDSAAVPPPYLYELERSTDNVNFTTVYTGNDIEQDTFYVDNNLNTQEIQYFYRVAFYGQGGNTLIGFNQSASSPFLEVFPFDKSNFISLNAETPWTIDSMVIFRENPTGSGNFDSLTTVYGNVTYQDTGLTNGENYCYFVRTLGSYSGSNLPAPLINNSQIACGVPLDTTGPCPPILDFEANCDIGYLRLFWVDETGPLCTDDIQYYNIYYKPNIDAEWPSSPLVSGITAQEFSNFDGSIVGCYAVTAVDDADQDNGGVANEGGFSNVVCVDGCPVIQLPNVFTPDDDGTNDFFTPRRDENGIPLFKDIDQFKITVYDRTGRTMYETTSQEEFINTGWNGQVLNSGPDCYDGVYFYVCSFTPRSISAPREQTINGTIHLFRR